MRLSNLGLISRGAVALVAVFLSLFLASLSVGYAVAADYHLGSLQISQPWARATPKGADSGAAYMTVMNTGAKPERLSCVSSDAADKCQIHQMSMDNGIMKMREIEGGVEIKPGETVTFAPGGYHVMLVGLKAPLVQGKIVAATLKIDSGATAQVEFPVAAIGAPAPGATGGGGMQMQGGGSMQMNGPGMMPMK
jgi:periplasmic copper chaperone A